jgi:propanol-preferring alcohol dehydrogenase
MSDIPSCPYDILWREHSVRSVANLTRQDGVEFIGLAPEVPVRTSIQVYPLAEANSAVDDMRHGRVVGTAVLKVGG